MSAGKIDIINIIRLGRLRFLLLGLILYLLGALLAAYSGFPLYTDRLAMGYLVLVTGHLSMHYSNDFFDYEADLHTNPNALSGGSGILREHPHLKATALYISLFLLLSSVILGAIFTWLYSYSPVYLGLVIFANLLGWYYAAPPISLSYRGLGEIATILGVGVLMPGAGALTVSGSIPHEFVVFLPVLGLYATSFIMSVEQPDMDADIAGKKRTFVVRNGRITGFAVMAVANLMATAYLLTISAITGTSIYIIASIISLLPLAVGLFGLIRKPADRVGVMQIVMASVGCFALFVLAMDVCLAGIYLLK